MFDNLNEFFFNCDVLKMSTLTFFFCPILSWQHNCSLKVLINKNDVISVVLICCCSVWMRWGRFSLWRVWMRPITRWASCSSSLTSARSGSSTCRSFWETYRYCSLQLGSLDRGSWVQEKMFIHSIQRNIKINQIKGCNLSLSLLLCVCQSEEWHCVHLHAFNVK